MASPIDFAQVADRPPVDPTLDLEAEIDRLKHERNAVILAHYYQDDEIQDLADFVGDSLSLSRTATKCEQDVIVFCGVKFMGETAKVLNPTRTVVLPDLEAGCSLVDGPRQTFRPTRTPHTRRDLVKRIPGQGFLGTRRRA